MADALDTVSLIAPMLGVVAVIILAYLSTRWLATRSSFKPVGGKRIHVIERVPLTRDTSLALVRVRGRTYLLSVGPGRVEQIGEMAGNNFTEGGAERAGDDFESLLARRVKTSKREAADEPPRRFREDLPEDRTRRYREEDVDDRPRRFRETPEDERPRRYRDQDVEERPRRGAWR